jgi:pimeloyl-ACP methyl ester carboxylesterase
MMWLVILSNGVPNVVFFAGKVPTQFIAGNVDGCTLADSSRNVEKFYSAGYQRVDLAAVGHFPHREQPGTVADLILDFCR